MYDYEETPYGYKRRVIGGTHPELVDYKCFTCDSMQHDVYYSSKADVSETVPCPCGEQATKVLLRTNFIHPSHSSLYGRPQPALGNEVIEDYGHKKRLMREYGLEESNDAVGGNRKRSEELKHIAAQKPRSSEQSTWIDGPG